MTVTTIAMTGIRLYQRHFSPHKGFRCAHAARFGGASCSAAVLHIIEAHGLALGWRDIQARFAACRSAHVHLQALESGNRRGWSARGVFCCGPIPIPFRCG